MSQPGPAAPKAASVSRRIRILLIVLPLLVLLAAALPALRKPLEWRDGAVIVRPLAGAQPKAKVSIPLVLQEGGDVAHESSHIFDVLSQLSGTAQCRLTPSPPSVEVSFDPALVSEQAIRDALASAGYSGTAQ